MNTQLIPRRSEVEHELATLRAELKALEVALAEEELAVTTLLAELAVFQARYFRDVGVLYAELDEWNARIAEFLAQRGGSQEDGSAVCEARVQAEKSARALGTESPMPSKFEPSLSLKRLYREVARKVHPDLATDEEDRSKREQLMVEANMAYQRGDAESLKRILERYESSQEGPHGTDLTAEVERVIRLIVRVRSRLSQIDQQATVVQSSHLAELKNRADAAENEGRDLLAEMAANLRKRIAAVRLQFNSLSTPHEVHEQ
jgi:hypothetical protein